MPGSVNEQPESMQADTEPDTQPQCREGTRGGDLERALGERQPGCPGAFKPHHILPFTAKGGNKG